MNKYFIWKEEKRRMKKEITRRINEWE